MTNKQLAALAAAVLVTLTVIIVLLVTGGAPDSGRGTDGEGDVEVSEGVNPPEVPAPADALESEVVPNGGEIVFSAEMAREIPRRLRDESMQWKWEIFDGPTHVYTLYATVDLGPDATIVQEEGGYSSSTGDETMPGSLDIQGARLDITLDPAEVPDFPDEFTWRLTTELDGDPSDPGSATATDTVPDGGFLRYVGDRGEA